MSQAQSPHQSGAVSMTLLLLLGLGAFLSWAAWFEIDQTVRAQGQMIPGARTQVIQAADGGVLSRILVKEGQSVVSSPFSSASARARRLKKAGPRMPRWQRRWYAPRPKPLSRRRSSARSSGSSRSSFQRSSRFSSSVGAA